MLPLSFLTIILRDAASLWSIYQSEGVHQRSLSKLRSRHNHSDVAILGGPEVDGLSFIVESLDHNVLLVVTDGPSPLSLHDLLSAISQKCTGRDAKRYWWSQSRCHS